MKENQGKTKEGRTSNRENEGVESPEGQVKGASSWEGLQLKKGPTKERG